MNHIITLGLVMLVLVFSVLSLWDRFRRDDGIQEWMLNVPGLDGLCEEYLDPADVQRAARSGDAPVS